MKLYYLFNLLIVALGLALFWGWVWNIVKIVQVMDVPLAEIAMLTVLRCIGVLVAPLGAVLGFF